MSTILNSINETLFRIKIPNEELSDRIYEINKICKIIKYHKLPFSFKLFYEIGNEDISTITKNSMEKLEKNPKDIHTKKLISQIYFSLGIEKLKSVSDINPNSKDVDNITLYTYAIEYFKKALFYNKDFELAKYYLADAYYFRGITTFNLINRSNSYYSIGNALKQVKQALKKELHIPQRSINQYSFCSLERCYSRIITDFEKSNNILNIYTLDNLFAELYYLRGIEKSEHANKKERTEALADFERTLKLKPEYINIYFRNGYYLQGLTKLFLYIKNNPSEIFKKLYDSFLTNKTRLLSFGTLCICIGIGLIISMYTPLIPVGISFFTAGAYAITTKFSKFNSQIDADLTKLRFKEIKNRKKMYDILLNGIGKKLEKIPPCSTSKTLKESFINISHKFDNIKTSIENLEFKIRNNHFTDSQFNDIRSDKENILKKLINIRMEIIELNFEATTIADNFIEKLKLELNDERIQLLYLENSLKALKYNCDSHNENYLTRLTHTDIHTSIENLKERLENNSTAKIDARFYSECDNSGKIKRPSAYFAGELFEEHRDIKEQLIKLSKKIQDFKKISYLKIHT